MSADEYPTYQDYADDIENEPEPPTSCVWPDVWRDYGGCQSCRDCEVNR